MKEQKFDILDDDTCMEIMITINNAKHLNYKDRYTITTLLHCLCFIKHFIKQTSLEKLELKFADLKNKLDKCKNMQDFLALDN